MSSQRNTDTLYAPVAANDSGEDASKKLVGAHGSELFKEIDISSDIEELQNSWNAPLKGEVAFFRRRVKMKHSASYASKQTEDSLPEFSDKICESSSVKNSNSELSSEFEVRQKLSRSLAGENSVLLLETKLSFLSRDSLTNLILEAILEFPGHTKLVDKYYLASLGD